MYKDKICDYNNVREEIKLYGSRMYIIEVQLVLIQIRLLKFKLLILILIVTTKTVS